MSRAQEEYDSLEQQWLDCRACYDKHNMFNCKLLWEKYLKGRFITAIDEAFAQSLSRLHESSQILVNPRHLKGERRIAHLPSSPIDEGYSECSDYSHSAQASSEDSGVSGIQGHWAPCSRNKDIMR